MSSPCLRAIEVACTAHQRLAKGASRHRRLSGWLSRGTVARCLRDRLSHQLRRSIDDAGTSIELFRDSVVPVCSPQILPRKGKVALKPADLATFELIAVDWLPKFASPPSWRDWFAAHGVATTTLRQPHQVHSLSSVAIQAAIDGHGFVLAQCSMVADNLAAGRLSMPVASAIPLPSPYFLTWRESTFDRPQCRAFHRWLLARAKEQQIDIDLLGLRTV